MELGGCSVALLLLVLIINLNGVPSMPSNETATNQTDKFGGKQLNRKVVVYTIKNQIFVLICCFAFIAVFSIWAFLSIVRVCFGDDVRSTRLYTGSYDEGSSTPNYAESTPTPNTYSGRSSVFEGFTPCIGKENWSFSGKLIKSDTTEEYLTDDEEKSGEKLGKVFATDESKFPKEGVPILVDMAIVNAKRNKFAKSKSNRETSFVGDSSSPFEQLSPVYNEGSSPGEVFLPNESGEMSEMNRSSLSDKYERILRPETLGPFGYEYLSPNSAEMIRSADSASPNNRSCSPGDIFLSDIAEEDELTPRNNMKSGSV